MAELPPPVPALLPAGGRVGTATLATLPSEGKVDGEYLADVSSCGSCHPDILAQQQVSAHAFASFNNPVYRLAVERLRDLDRGAGQTCAGCHDAALLVDGAMAKAISASDYRAHNGVSCRLCHGIKEASLDGNASYVLAAQPLPLPIGGDAASLERHKQAARPPSFAAFCGGCHQSFLSPASGNAVFLAGQNELSAWGNSAYAGAGSARVDRVERKSCVQCHMAKVAASQGDAAADHNGEVSSHYFLGAHTWLAAMRGDKDQLARAQDFLVGVASIDVISEVLSSDNGEGADRVSLEVVVRNTSVGHHFPSGVRDAADTWIEVEVLALDGSVLLYSAPGDSQHRLRAIVADKEGVVLERRETHRFAGLIIDHTIAPRDVALVRYQGRLPGAKKAARIRARLMHRSRGQALVDATCLETRSARGRAYAKAGRAMGRDVLDGCLQPPTTLIAEVTRSFGDRGDESFARSYERGLGLLHEVQERVDSARPSLLAALRLAGDDPDRRAMALHALAKLEGRLGRANASLQLLEQAKLLVPENAALFATEGDALARVWRWQEAAEAYGKATVLAEGNSSLWRRYAVALGSAGSPAMALRAAQRGLRLLPRDADLLRVQALALQTLGGGDAELAMESYLKHRGPDNVGNTRLLCAERTPLCGRESLRVHTHALEVPRRVSARMIRQ